MGSENERVIHYDRQDEPQVPLSIKYETKPIWADLKDTFGVDAMGASVILAAVEAAGTGREVSYSRRKEWYSPGWWRHPLMTYTRVIRAVDSLAAAGWLIHYKQVPGGLGWQSAFEATPALIAEVQRILDGKPKLRLIMPPRLTIIRDEAGQPIDYRLTREIDRQDRRTAIFNEAITSANVGLANADNVVNLACPMARIFNGSLERGGRFYGMGTSWQNIPADDRKRIEIDGDDTAELDFKSLHPAMLYAEVGATMPGACYDIAGWPRGLVKVALLTLINARTEAAARMSIAHSDKMALIYPPGKSAIPVAARLIADIKRKHSAIAHLFHSDAGARLMNRDSAIAEAVMGEMIGRRGIVALPVHDSFIVPASKRGDLELVMFDAARKAGLRSIEITAK